MADSPLFEKEKIEDIERLLREIEDGTVEESTLTAQRERAKRQFDLPEKRRLTADEKRREAQQEREALWRKHIDNVNVYLDNQKKPTLEPIEQRRRFREAKRRQRQNSHATLVTENGVHPGEASNVLDAKRELFSEMLVNGDDLEDFFNEKISGPLPRSLKMF